MKTHHIVLGGLACLLVALGWSCVAVAQAPAADERVPEEIRAAVEDVVAKVKPALVRIEVVSTYYEEGRESKFQSAGSGVIISKDGYIVTNHHVAGHAVRLLCTLSSKEEIEAELIGKDPMTDIAVIKLKPSEPREFPTASFGDSSIVKVGDSVLAMGSPMSLSQSVTMGIASNIELVMPEWLGQSGEVTQDGENVGSLVRWIGHDAQIYGGNSGGPLVNLNGEIIGINEISVGSLGGAIPGNLAKDIAEKLIAQGRIVRAWLGTNVQPRLKSDPNTHGVLVSGVLANSPAELGGLKSGDILLRLNGAPADVQFLEQLPSFNQMAADLPIGQPAEAVVLRDGQELTLTITPIERELAAPQEYELKKWGITARNLSLLIAQEMKRDNQEGVMVTSVRPGGPAGDAKPQIQPNDIILKAGGKPVKNLEELAAVTKELTQDKTDPVPTLVSFERKAEQYVTVVKVGVRELEDPGLEVKKAWLPVLTQVLTREIAQEMGNAELRGFRVTKVFEGSTAEKAGLKVGDCIFAVDAEPMTASAPEDYDDLPALIRQYRIGDTVELDILRDGLGQKISVELIGAPELPREMKRYRDENFEFTARDITFFDKSDEKWKEEQQGVLAEEVVNGGWAAVALMSPGDLIVEVDGQPVQNVETFEKQMNGISSQKPKTVVFKVLRGIHTMFLEIEPNWDSLNTNGKG